MIKSRGLYTEPRVHKDVTGSPGTLQGCYRDSLQNTWEMIWQGFTAKSYLDSTWTPGTWTGQGLTGVQVVFLCVTG